MLYHHRKSRKDKIHAKVVGSVRNGHGNGRQPDTLRYYERTGLLESVRRLRKSIEANRHSRHLDILYV